MNSGSSFTKLVILSQFLTVILQACATAPTQPSGPEKLAKQDKSLFYIQNQEELFARNPPVESSFGNLQLVVRLATPAELPENESGTNLYGAAIGSGSLAAGLAAPPLYASSLVVGGFILLPLGTYLYLHDKRIWESLNRALSNADLTSAIESELRTCLTGKFPAVTPPEEKAELIVASFGLVKSTDDSPLCLELSAELILSRGPSELKRDRLLITYRGRSEDAPPPQCASLERFAENDAQLVKDSLEEYKKVLASMAADRISGGMP